VKRVLFDTSILVASVVQDHSQHQRAISWLRKVKQGQVHLVLANHSVVECYSVLTRMPLSPRISPDMAKRLIAENFASIAEIAELPKDEYFDFFKECAERHLSGGIVYDALIFKIALTAKVDSIVTLNPKDFARLSDFSRASIEVVS
jgi:predicted nucleic acid-binding protein